MSIAEDEFIEFCHGFQQDIIIESLSDEKESTREDKFTEKVMDDLAEADIIENPDVCSHRQKVLGIKINGYAFNDNGDNLDLFLSIYKGEAPPQSVSRTEIENAFKRLQNFFKRCLANYFQELEEAQPVFDLALRIAENKEQIHRLNFFIITDGVTKVETIEDISNENYSCSFHVWDIRRYHALVSSRNKREAIEIDLYEKFGGALPYLSIDNENPVYQSYLIILPGKTLVDIYDVYGPRLLERNIRSFLQVRGIVNRGIRTTILDEPWMFLAYNNGLSTTAESIETACIHGQNCITRLKNFQIINGAQTTASLHSTYYKNKKQTDLSKIFIPVKLTVLKDQSRLDELVPQISKFANTQNKIDAADFSSNHPFHVALQELSRRIRVPPEPGSQVETRWYYERVRGQYLDDHSRNKTVSQKKDFERIFPRHQKFDKTELAVFEHTWLKRPYDVSLGKQKNYKLFMADLNENKGIPPDEKFFRHIVAKAILYRETYRIIRKELKGGYFPNIATYLLAFIHHKTNNRLDLDRVWNEQKLSPELNVTITRLCHTIQKYIVNPPDNRNITEWCKKKECWENLLKEEISLPDEISGAFSSLQTESTLVEDGEEGKDIKITSDSVLTLPPETWFGISHWAKETNSLLPWQRNLVYNIGRLVKLGKNPTEKQVRQARIILLESLSKGYKDDNVLSIIDRGIEREILNDDELFEETNNESENTEEIYQPAIKDEINTEKNLNEMQKVILFILRREGGKASMKTLEFSISRLEGKQNSGFPATIAQLRRELIVQRKSLVKLGLVQKEIFSGNWRMTPKGFEYCQTYKTDSGVVSEYE